MNRQTPASTPAAAVAASKPPISQIVVRDSRIIHDVEWRPVLRVQGAKAWYLAQAQIIGHFPIYIKSIWVRARDKEKAMKGYITLVTSSYRQDDRPYEAAHIVLEHIKDDRAVSLPANMALVGETSFAGRIEFDLQIDDADQGSHVSTAIRFALWVFEVLHIDIRERQDNLAALQLCSTCSTTEFSLAKTAGFDENMPHRWISEGNYQLYRHGLCPIDELLFRAP